MGNRGDRNHNESFHEVPPAPAAAALITHTISPREWLDVARRLDLTHQQGLIVRLMFTSPRQRTTIKGLARMLRSRSDQPLKPSTIDEQLQRMYRDLGIHSRDELLARVFTELAVVRGWVKDGQA